MMYDPTHAKKAMKTKSHIVSGFMNTYANVPENIWQDRHSTGYLPHGPSRSPLYPALCPGRLSPTDASLSSLALWILVGLGWWEPLASEQEM